MTTVLVPLSRAEIALPPTDQLRRVMLTAWQNAQSRTSDYVPPPSDPAKYRLPFVESRVLATIHRCPTCGQWTCAPRFQRTPHDCNRKDVA